MKEGNCYFCEEKGHRANTCPKKSNSIIDKAEKIFKSSTKNCGQFVEVERRSRLEFLDYLAQILEVKIGKSFDFVLDSLNFGMNKVSQFS